MTIAEALRSAAARLAAAGVTDPERDTERLLGHVLGWDRAKLLAEGRAALAPDPEARFQALVEKRTRRSPLQHLVGTQAFWGHEFLVSPEVLIPRPETELILQAALDALRAVDHPVVVDVGTGSGCLALSLAAERSDAVVHAVELSPAALAVAQENARRLSLTDRVRFHLGDLLEPVQQLTGRVDLIMSNPPYVDAAAFATLDPEVRLHEPRMALVPPGEPYSIYRRLAPQAHRLLRAGGWLLLEVGQGMDAEVVGICAAEGLRVVQVIPDLQTIPRTVVARRGD